MKKTLILTSIILSTLMFQVACQNQIDTQVNEIQNQDLEEISQDINIIETAEIADIEISEPVPELVETETKLYRGSWFDVQIPSNFIANPTTPTTVYNAEEYIQTDEARFSSPDNSIEFFVFSPLWAGDPSYISISETEELVSEKTDESGPENQKIVVVWKTIKAKDGSYTRSFVSTKENVGEGLGLHHVFGIKYKDSNSYDKYKDDYIFFKESLRQYAD